MTKVLAETLKVGDVVLPPAREIQLWMRKRLAEKGLTESALYLTITSIEEGTPDKRGRWISVECAQTPEWLEGAKPYPFCFKARPDTLWPKVA